jgi:transposase
MLELFGLVISEGALDAMFRRSRTCLDAEVSAILARLRRARVVYCDETGVRVKGQGCWNWAEPAKVPAMRSIGGRQAEGFQNTEVVIHVIRHSRGAGVVGEVMDGHRPAIWVPDLYGAQQGHADAWQICLAHQLRDCQSLTGNGTAMRRLRRTNR